MNIFFFPLFSSLLFSKLFSVSSALKLLRFCLCGGDRRRKPPPAKPQHFALISLQNLKTQPAVIQMLPGRRHMPRDMIQQPANGGGGFFSADVPLHAK